MCRYNRSVLKNDTAGSAAEDRTKSALTRERILDSAAYVLSRKGFAGTRLVDVAAHAELQAPAIYYYFKSREELIEEVMFVGISNIRAHVSEVLEALDPQYASYRPHRGSRRGASAL